MSAIRQKFTAGIGGILFVSENVITATSASIINDDLNLSSSVNKTFPIYAENDSSGNVKMIAVETEYGLSVCQFLDKDLTVVFDAVSANGGNLLARQSYIFPGNAPLNITELDDIKLVRLRSLAGGDQDVRIAVAYDMDENDNIT
jgi:hypothetical protein